MNKDQLWAKFCEINPSLVNQNGDKVSMTPAQIKKMVETTWKYAHEEGFNSGKEVARKLFDLAQKGSGGSSSGDIFNQVFGGGISKK